MFQKFKALLQRALRRKREELRLVTSDDGVTLFADDREVWSFRWDEVTRVETYKRDLFTVDMICLDFFVDSRHVTYSTHDEMHGFNTLCEQLRRSFPSVAEDWWSRVASPPFATNYKVLYESPAV